MNWDQVAAGWASFRGRIKEEWGRLTDDDLDVIAGRYDQLIGTLERRYGVAHEDAEREVHEWLQHA